MNRIIALCLLIAFSGCASPQTNSRSIASVGSHSSHEYSELKETITLLDKLCESPGIEYFTYTGDNVRSVCNDDIYSNVKAQCFKRGAIGLVSGLGFVETLKSECVGRAGGFACVYDAALWKKSTYEYTVARKGCTRANKCFEKVVEILSPQFDNPARECRNQDSDRSQYQCYVNLLNN